MFYLLLISSPCQNRRMAEHSSPESQELCLEITALESHDHRMFGNKNSFSCQSNFGFCCDKIHPKPYRGLPQASHGIILEVQLASHGCHKKVISWGRLQHLLKQDHCRFCGLTLNLSGNWRKRMPGRGVRNPIVKYFSLIFLACKMNCLKHPPFLLSTISENLMPIMRKVIRTWTLWPPSTLWFIMSAVIPH